MVKNSEEKEEKLRQKALLQEQKRLLQEQKRLDQEQKRLYQEQKRLIKEEKRLVLEQKRKEKTLEREVRERIEKELEEKERLTYALLSIPY